MSNHPDTNSRIKHDKALNLRSEVPTYVGFSSGCDQEFDGVS